MIGKCACGKVSFSFSVDEDNRKAEEGGKKSVGACHCKTCQAVSGGVYLFVECKEENFTIDIESKQNVSSWASSEHCQRSFCRTCGSTLYAYIPVMKMYHVSPGCIQGSWPKEFKLTNQIFTDRKPDCINFAKDEDMIEMTGEECYKAWGMS